MAHALSSYGLSLFTGVFHQRANTTVLQTVWSTKRATWKLPNQHTSYANAQRGDGVRIVTLGADAIRVGGTSSGVLVAIARDYRLRPRGKNGSAQPQGTHRRRCIGWHGGEIRASLVLHNVQGRAPASVPDNPAR